MATTLKELPLDDVKLGKRYREDYDTEDLVESIKEVGILQPITVTPDPTDGKYLVLAGGRRWCCAMELDFETIPCLIRDIDGDLDLREIEYIENAYRKDLTWTERMNLVVEIHRLMQEKHGSKWNQRKTAQKLEKSVGGINRLLQLHGMIQKFPKLIEEKTEDDAVKKARKILEMVSVTSMVKKHQEEYGDEADHEDDYSIGEDLDDEDSEVSVPESNYIRFAKNATAHYRIGDAFQGMEEIIADPDMNPPIGLIEVDPPYGIDLQTQKKGGETRELNRYEEVEADAYEEFTARVARDIFDIAPKNSRLIYWFGISWYSTVLSQLKKVGFDVDPIPGIWVKPAGQANNPDKYLARTYETFFIATKGDGIPIRQRGRSNVFSFAPVPASKKYHPTQRPIELMQEILKTFAWPNSVILVPFLGSGVTLRAAYHEGMVGFGWELNEDNKPKFLASVQADIEAIKGGE